MSPPTPLTLRAAPSAATVAHHPLPDRALDLWTHANDVLYVHDLTGRFTAVNATALQTYGYTEAEFLAMAIKDLVDPDHLPQAQANLQAKASGSAERSPPYELLTRAKDGRAVWVEVSTRILLEDGRPAAVQGAARDITARKQAEAVADLVHEAALALNEAPTLEAGVLGTMARVAQAAGWSYAEAWFPDADGKALQLGPQWSATDGLEKFSRLARQYRFTPGEGIPGRLWQTRQPMVLRELPPVDECPRRAAATAAGLGTVVGVPVENGGRFAAALVFFGTRPRPEDERWGDAARRLAAHLGAAIGRRLDIERVRTAGRLFAAQFEAMDDGLLLLDTEGVPRHANRAFLHLLGRSVASTDPAVPLLDRVDDRARFLADVATLYEDRTSGRDQVQYGGRPLRRTVTPLRSRSGTGLGVLLRVHE